MIQETLNQKINEALLEALNVAIETARRTHTKLVFDKDGCAIEMDPYDEEIEKFLQTIKNKKDTQ